MYCIFALFCFSSLFTMYMEKLDPESLWSEVLLFQLNQESKPNDAHLHSSKPPHSVSQIILFPKRKNIYKFSTS
jgi:hypothetical protein